MKGAARMHRSILVAALCLAASAGVVAQAPTEFVGALEPLAAPGRLATSIALSPVSGDARSKIGSVAEAGEQVWVGELSIGAGKQPVYVMQSAAGRLSVATDLDRNGTIEATERVTMAPETQSAKTPEAAGLLAATLRLMTPGAAFPDFPVRVGLTPKALEPAIAGQGPASPKAYLRTSYQAFAVGSVAVDGRAIKVRLIVNPKEFTVNPAKSYQYVDCNGDGELDDDMTSWEMGYASGEPVVFHVGTGDRYVSIKGIDVAKRTITLSARTAAEYERIELRLGSTVPDFAFTTLDGSPRRLSEFRGKYLLLDFWGTWCGPCVGEIPYLKKAYEAYKDQGFEILGLDSELPDVTPEDFAKGLEGVKKFVADKGVTWPQARTESIKRIYEKRFQVVAWPTLVLLDPKGAILSVGRTSQGEPGLRGEELEKTLAAIFKRQ